MRPTSFNALRTEMERLGDADDRSGALDLVARSEPLFPSQAALTRMLRIELLAGMGQTSEAIELLRNALDRDFRYRGRWLRHERFAALAGEPEFAALVERSDAQYEGAQADARPDLMTLVPRIGDASPMIIALHGNNSTMADTARSWQSVVQDGWLLALPQSSEISTTPGFFVWNDRERAAQDLNAHITTLRSQFAVNSSDFVLGGFSMGARLALELGISGRFPARRILAIATWLPDFPELAELLEANAARESRVYVVVGRQDHSGYDGSVRLVEHLRTLGASAEIEIHDGGHEEPPDMPAALRRGLEFLGMPGRAA